MVSDRIARVFSKYEATRAVAPHKKLKTSFSNF